MAPRGIAGGRRAGTERGTQRDGTGTEKDGARDTAKTQRGRTGDEEGPQGDGAGLAVTAGQERGRGREWRAGPAGRACGQRGRAVGGLRSPAPAPARPGRAPVASR